MAETNPEIGKVYSKRKMSEENPLESDAQFMDSFMTLKSMVHEMYRNYKKHRYEDASSSKQEKGVEESLLHDHSKGKGKEEKFLTPPNSPEKKRHL